MDSVYKGMSEIQCKSLFHLDTSIVFLKKYMEFRWEKQKITVELKHR